MSYFAVWATDAPGTQAARLAIRDAHRARLREPGPVRVIHGGPTLDEAGAAMNGSLLIVEAEDLAAVRRFVDGDPYVAAGVYASVEIRPWQWGLRTTS